MSVLRVAVQMDPIDTMVVDRDTSLALMVEAQRRGHEVWWFTPNELHYDTGVVNARARRVSVRLVEGDHYTTHEEAIRAADDFDVILVRQDPPFDMGYVSNTYLLELTRALVLNPPRGIRDISEKLSILRFPELTPPTWVGRDLDALEDFAKRYEQVVLKVLYMMGGDGVIRLSPHEHDFRNRALKFIEAAGREPVMAQEYLPRVSEGDKRVFVLGGDAIGAVRRMPQGGDFRANLHVGGKAVSTDLDARDKELAHAVAPLLREEGILFAGLDVIDGRLTEINVTSPTLVQQLIRFGGPDLPKLFWERVEAMLG